MPDAFLAVDYMLDRFAWLVEGLVVRTERMRENLDVEPRARISASGCCSRSSSRAARATTPTGSCSATRCGRGTRGSTSRSSCAPTPRSPARVDLDAVFDLGAVHAPRRRRLRAAACARARSTCMPEAPSHLAQRQGARALRARRGAAAARRVRPDLDLRRRPADRDPRQGASAHRALGVLVRAHARASSRTICSRCATTAARSSAGGWRCCRSRCVVRGYLAGLRLEGLPRDGAVCGHALPAGPASSPIGCRSRSSRRRRRRTSGHDENIDARGRGRARRRRALRRGRARRARALRVRGRRTREARGIILADTKFELGARRRTGRSCSATRR